MVMLLLRVAQVDTIRNLGTTKSRSVRGRKSINTNNNNNKNSAKIGSAPRGLCASIVSLPSEALDHHPLDVTSVESVHSDDIVDMRTYPEHSYDTGAFIVTCLDDDEDDITVSTDDGTSLIFVHSPFNEIFLLLLNLPPIFLVVVTTYCRRG